MSAQSAKKKRLGSRRRLGNQNEMSKTDDSHGTGSIVVAQRHIPEENTDSLNVLANFDNSHSEIQRPTSPELLGNRRKLGSRRKNKEQHVKDSVTESYHEPREEVDHTTRGLAIQPERQADASPDYSSEANCSEADLQGFSSKMENLHADREENETDSEVISESCKFVETMQEGIDNPDLHNEEVKESAHLVGISELTSFSVLSRPTVDQQLIDRSNCREQLPNVCSATENEGKERDDNTELFFSTTPERTTENTEMECSVQQGTIVSPKEELPTKVKQNEHFNLYEVTGAHHSEDAVNKLHENEIKITDMHEIAYSSESRIHDTTENSEISGNLINQTEVYEKKQFELIVKNTDESPTNQDNSNPDNIQDENVEALEWRNEDYHVYDTKEPQISDIEKVDTALSQVFEMEGRVQGDTKPSAEQTGQQEQEGLLSETEESASSLQTLQSEINVPFDSQPQPNDTSFNSIGNRRKLGSSRRNKGRQHVKDSVAESDHEHTEDVVGEVSDYETLETTEMTLLIETAVLEKSMETLLEETDKFDTAQTEDVTHHVKENAQDGTLVAIGNLNSSGLQASSTVDQQTIEQSHFREMPEEEVPNVCSVTEKENEEIDEDTDWFRQDGNLQGKYLVSQDIESSITPEMTTEKHSRREHTEPECSVEQEIFSSPKEELQANEGQNKIFNLPKAKGDYHSEVAVNKLHEQDVEPTENQEMPQLDYSSEDVIHDATENSEIISGNLMNQTEVSDTYQSELAVKNTDDSSTNRDNSNPDNIQDEHPTEENHFEASEQKNKDFDVYVTKEPQISDIERVDTALSQVFEMEGRVQGDTKPSAEQAGQQEQEGLLSETEESASSLQTLKSEINLPFDSQPQPNDISYNSIENRRKLGSSRRKKGRQHVKDSVAESDHEHTEDVESTRGNEALETVQMSLQIERTSHEELSQESQNDIMPATHDSSWYSAITPGYSSEVQSPTLKHYPEAVLERVIPKSENLHEDHDDRENDFKVEVSDKSVEAMLEGVDTSDALQSQEFRGDHHTWDAVNKLHEQDVELTENQDMPKLDYSSESVTHNATEDSENISGNMRDETEVSDTYQSQLTGENTDDSPTNRDNSNPDNIRDENVEALEWRNEDYHVYDTKEPQISNIEKVDTALSQVFEMEGRVQGDTKPSAEQTGQQKQKGLLSETEESASSLQTLQTEINVPFDSQPQPNDTSFNSIGNRRKLGSSRRNKGRQHVKDSVAESDHEHTEDVVGEISNNETLETTEMTLLIETAVQEKSMETLLEETDKFDTAQTEDVTHHVKENAQDGTLVAIGNLNSSALQSSSTVDQQTIEQSHFREMPEEEVPNVCSVTEKENEEIDEDTDWFRQDGNLQGKYLVSQDIESSITPEMTTEKHSRREHTEPECSVEQEIFSSPKEELQANEGQNKIFNLPKAKGDYHSEVAVNKLHEQDVEPTENQEMPQLDYSSEDVIHDATENSEIISGNLMNQTEVSDTYQSELAVKNTDDSSTNRDNSNPDNIQDEHPTEENHFEASEQKNKDFDVYVTKEPQISDIERVDTALSQVFEMEGRVQGDTKPSAEQAGQQEQEGLLSETEESASSLQTLKSEINLPFDSQPQPNDISFNSIGNRRKLGSSRRKKGRQHVKDSVAESDHEHTEDVESTRGNEALETVQMSLQIERTSHEELSQESQNDIMPATHDSSWYSAITPGYSSEVQSPTLKHYPEAVLERVIPKSENLHEDHDDRENDFKVEVSDKSVEAMLEGVDTSDALQSQEFRGDHHTWDAVNKLHEQDVELKENQDMPKLDYSSESVTHNATEDSENISGNMRDETEVSDTYQSQLTGENTDDSPTNRDNSNPDNIRDENVEALEWRNEDYHVYDTKEPQISNIEKVDTALSQVFEMEGRVQGDTKPSAEQTGQQKQKGLLSETEESASSLQTLQTEINVPFDSQPQPNDTSFNSIGNRRKLGSSRRNKGRQHVKDSVAESDHEHTEDVVGEISNNETLETTEMTLLIETAVQEKSMETLLEETDKFDTAQTEDVTHHVKENAQDGTLVAIGNLNISGLQASSTVDQQTIEQSHFREMPEEEVPNVCSVTEKENEEIDEDTDWFRQDGNLQGKYLVTESHVKSEDIESSITLEINTEKNSPKGRNEIECGVEQADFPSSEEKLPTNEEQKEHVNVSLVRGTWHSQEALNEVHEEVIKPTQMQERHQTDNISIKDSESNLQKLQSEMNAPLDSQPLDNSQNITEQTHKDATEMSLVMKTMRQEEIKERTDLDSKSAGEMRKKRSTDKENTEKMSADDTILSQNVMGNNAIVTTDITSSSSKDDSVKSNKEVTEEENHLIKETENLGQFTGYDTVQMDLIQSSEVLVGKEDSDIQSSSYQDDVTARSNTSDEAFQVQNKEASNFDKETIMQQANDTSETVGNVIIKDCKTGAESTMYVQVYEQDEDGAQFEDPAKKENEAQETNVSKEMFSAPHNKTDATFDIGLKDETLRAEPAVDVSEESGIISHQGIQEKSNLDDSENLQGRSKQKRRKMGSTRRTQLNRKPEEDRVKTKKNDREADMRNLDKMEVVEELTMIATAEVSQNKNAKPSLSLVYKEQMETNETNTVDVLGQKLQSSDLQSNMMSDIDYSKALSPEQSGSHSEDIVDPVKCVHVADVSDSKRHIDVSVEPSQIDEMHITSAFAGRNTNTGISGLVSLCETTQSTDDEESPESVNIIQDQTLKSTEALVLADLEKVKSVVKGEAGEEHVTAGANKQEPDNANEGAHKKNLEMKNASSYLDTSSRRRKMGSTRRNLRTGTKQEDLHQKQDVNDEATHVGDVRTESFSSIIKDELQLDGKHKDGNSETTEYSHSGESHKPLAHQTFEDNPVSQRQLLETEQQLTPSDFPAMPSTSPKHDLISESASGGRRRKMGSHRKSHGHQNYENQTPERDRITDTPNEREVRSLGEESAIKTEALKEQCLGLDKIVKVDKSHKKPLSNLSTSKEGEHPRPVSEKTPESVTPVQHHYTEHQQKLSLTSRADMRLNVMMVGDSSVGKTSFMKRAQSGKFSLDIPASIGLDSCMWTVVVEGKPVVLQLWDTAGQERFHSLTRQIFHKADAFLLMYDVTSSQSFSAVSYWASCIQEGAAESVTILLVGNKSDRAERQVTTQEAEYLAKEYNFEFIECSAATGENVVKSLETVARMLSQKVDPRDDTMVLHKEPQPKTSRCC